MKTVTLTTFNRPSYLRRVLMSLRQNRYQDYTLFVGMEPGCPEVERILDEIRWIRTVIIKNPQRLHNKWNLKNIIETAIQQGSQFNVCLEDDVILSPDALDLANWFFNLRTNDYLTLGFFNYSSDPSFPNEISETNYFNPLGWCFALDGWRRTLAPNWMSDQRGWDFSITALLKRQPALKTLHPKFSRSNHIGRENGVHCTPEFHDRTFSHLEISTGQSKTYFIRKQAVRMDVPLVTALMVTGKDETRPFYARRAIDCFLQQTYPNKELLIINHGRESVFTPDVRIRELRIMKAHDQTLGSLRNIGLDFARGSLILTWDDDDWYHPLRMEVQIAAYQSDSAILLKNQIRYSFQSRSAFILHAESGIHSTILHSCGVPFRYRDLTYGEDTDFLHNFQNVIAVDNDPSLYIRFHHGNNMSSASHLMGNFASPEFRNSLFLTSEQRELLSTALKAYDREIA